MAISGTNLYQDADGLVRKYGVLKAVPNTAGEYKTYGGLREIEVIIDLSKLTSSSVIQSYQTFFPKNVFIEQVTLEVLQASTTAGSPTLDVGLVQTDGSTAVTPTTSSWTTNSVFIAAEVDSGVIATLGKKITYTAAVSKAGGGIGLAAGQVGYITARVNASTWSAGFVSVKISYRGYNS